MADSKGSGCMGIIVAAVVIGGLSSMCSDGSDSTGDEYGAQSACEDWVKDQLKAPATADFGDEDVSGGGGSWTVTGVVDAENGFGANIRTSWTCDVRLDSDDYYRGNATLFE